MEGNERIAQEQRLEFACDRLESVTAEDIRRRVFP